MSKRYSITSRPRSDQCWLRPSRPSRLETQLGRHNNTGFKFYKPLIYNLINSSSASGTLPYQHPIYDHFHGLLRTHSHRFQASVRHQAPTNDLNSGRENQPPSPKPAIFSYSWGWIGSMGWPGRIVAPSCTKLGITVGTAWFFGIYSRSMINLAASIGVRAVQMRYRFAKSRADPRRSQWR